jgi:hypothetical protein
MTIKIDVSRFEELRQERREAVALAPQDRTGTGTLAFDSPLWVWVPVDAAETPELWWEGSDYPDPAARPAFRPLPRLPSDWKPA